MNRKQIKVVNEILNSRYDRCICTVCGNYQSHSLIWCSSCGGKFEIKAETLFDAMRIADNRQLQKRKIVLRPYYIAAVWKRHLNKFQISQKDFIDYVTKKLAF